MEPQHQRRRFSKEFRSNIVRSVIDGGRTASAVATEHGIPTASVYAWVCQARVEAGDLSLHNEITNDQTELSRLRKVLKELE